MTINTARPQVERLKTLINIAKGQLALDEDTYRAMLKGTTGKDSLRAMGIHELETVLEVLKQKGFKPSSNPNAKGNKAGVKRRLSPSSGKSKTPIIDKIVAVWITMGHHCIITDPSEAALDAYVRRMTHKASQQNWGEGVDSVRWLGDEQAAKVLESLKHWHKRVLLERIAARGERIERSGYEAVVAQYEGHGVVGIKGECE